MASEVPSHGGARHHQSRPLLEPGLEKLSNGSYRSPADLAVNTSCLNTIPSGQPERPRGSGHLTKFSSTSECVCARWWLLFALGMSQGTLSPHEMCCLAPNCCCVSLAALLKTSVLCFARGLAEFRPKRQGHELASSPQWADGSPGLHAGVRSGRVPQCLRGSCPGQAAQALQDWG